MICYVCTLSIPVIGCIFCKELAEETVQIIRYRYDAPNKYDQTEFGSIIRVNAKDNRFDIYRNASREMQEPLWEHEGNFLDKKGHNNE